MEMRPVRLLISHQPTTSNQPAVLFSQNKPAPAISHQPNEQADGIRADVYGAAPIRFLAGWSGMRSAPKRSHKLSKVASPSRNMLLVYHHFRPSIKVETKKVKANNGMVYYIL
jgi:hypothetical protein